MQSLDREVRVLDLKEEVHTVARLEAQPNLILTVAVMNPNTDTQNILRNIITHNKTEEVAVSGGVVIHKSIIP